MLEVRAWGHPALRATHAKTLELARDREVSERASCVLGVGAEYDAAAAVALAGPVTVELSVAGGTFALEARVAPLPSAGDGLVLRRSDCAGGRTFAHSATAAAADLPRPMAARLADPATEVVAAIAPREGAGALVVLPWLDPAAPPAVADGLREAAGTVVAHAGALPAGAANELLAVLRRPGRAIVAVPVLDPRAGGAEVLVAEAARAGAEVAVAAGAPHAVRLLAGSGIASGQATFLAAPSGRREAERAAGAIASSPLATVAGPGRRADLLLLLDALPADRAACLMLDAGGECERLVHASVAACRDRLEDARAEADVAVAVAPGAASSVPPEVAALVRALDAPPSDVARALATALGIPRREAYDHVRRLRGE